MKGRLGFATIAILVGLMLHGGLTGCSRSSDTSAIAAYHCPMHPTYVSDRPGDCPICNMKLVPIAEPERPAAEDVAVPEGYSVVRIREEGVALAGIRTETATLDTLHLSVRTVGLVKPDETRVREVTTRVSGWVEALSVSFTGQFVRRGDPILAIYSPELLASQEEYLGALEAARRFQESSLPEVREGAEALLHSARSRLLLYDVPASLIQRIATSGEVERLVTLEAPATGFVTGKEVFAGSRVEPQMTLFTIADLSTIWIEADVYEVEASKVSVGTEAAITLPYDPSFERSVRVSYIHPTLDPMTRTLKVRFDLPNEDLTLRPNMYADVELRLEAEAGVVIPDDAILDTGTRRIVFVETAPGTYEPREVIVGVRSGGRARILSGVAEGERIVVGSNFLLDSESRIKAAVGRSKQDHTHGDAP